MQSTKSFTLLKKNTKELAQKNLIDLFNEDKNRAEDFSLSIDDLLYFDFSKNFVNKESIKELCNIANELDLKTKIDAMFKGEKINNTEDRAVWHCALRDKTSKHVLDGVDYTNVFNQSREKMQNFAELVRSGKKLSHTGKKFKKLVHIGIGGSHLGVEFIYNALGSYERDLEILFVSNIDADNIKAVLRQCNEEETLIVVASKTFTTQEVIVNANTAKNWLLDYYKGDEKAIKAQFIALSSNAKEVEKFGIDTDNMFTFWDFIGGRYSSFSSIGLSLAICYGYDVFEQMIEGAFLVDKHFKETDFSKNIPFMLAGVGIVNNNILDYSAYTLVPYSHNLKLFANYVQQLEMESNGKQVDKQGKPLMVQSTPVVFGVAGTDSQHSYFQMVHQSTRIIPVDFIGFKAKFEDKNEEKHHKILLSHMLAQSRALMVGKTKEQVEKELVNQGLNQSEIEELSPHKVFYGNRVSNTILLNELSAKTIGALIALYELKTFVQGVFFNVNSFDQWGVELGKQLSSEILQKINQDDFKSFDCSTNKLLSYLFK